MMHFQLTLGTEPHLQTDTSPPLSTCDLVLAGWLGSKQECVHDFWRLGIPQGEGGRAWGGGWAELFTLFWPQSDQGFAHLRRLQTLTKIKFYFEFLSHIAISSLGILTKRSNDIYFYH